MDTFYISHGAPTLAIDDSLPARHFLKTWQEQGFTEKPKSVLIISGHWETDVPTVNVVQQNDIIYDFYGFPSKMYKVLLYSPDLVKNMLLIGLIKEKTIKRERYNLCSS